MPVHETDIVLPVHQTDTVCTRGSGENNWFVNNTCVANAASGGFRSDCSLGKGMHNSGNTIWNADGNLGEQKMCDPTNKVAKTPGDDAIIALGKKVIGWRGETGEAR